MSADQVRRLKELLTYESWRDVIYSPLEVNEPPLNRLVKHLVEMKAQSEGIPADVEGHEVEFTEGERRLRAVVAHRWACSKHTLVRRRCKEWAIAPASTRLKLSVDDTVKVPGRD
jgi:hypothetical protein